MSKQRNKAAICDTCPHFHIPEPDNQGLRLCHLVPKRKSRRMYATEWCKKHPDFYTPKESSNVLYN